MKQAKFNMMIGRLDHILSKMVSCGKKRKLSIHNKQTLKHHAEDMIAAGEKILKDLGKVEGLPQPKIATKTKIVEIIPGDRGGCAFEFRYGSYSGFGKTMDEALTDLKSSME